MILSTDFRPLCKPPLTCKLTVSICSVPLTHHCHFLTAAKYAESCENSGATAEGASFESSTNVQGTSLSCCTSSRKEQARFPKVISKLPRTDGVISSIE